MAMRPVCLKLFVGLLALVSVAACGRHGGEFRLKGKVKHFRQGEFYIYSSRGFDTVRVQDFAFNYHRATPRPEVLTVLFPNFQRLPLVARPGLKLSMTTDARNFNNTQLKGDDENRRLSRFFRENGGLPMKRMRQAASLYIRQHPDELASVALLRYCFVDGAAQPDAEATRLLAELRKAQPSNAALATLQRQLAPTVATARGGRLPQFSVTATDGRRLTQAALRGHYTLITFWADWHNASYSNVRRVRGLWQRYSGRLQAVNVSLDADRSRSLRTIRRDTLPGYNVCDTRCFDTHLARALAVRRLPANVLVGGDGVIMGRDMTPDEITRRLDPLIPH